VIYFRYSERKSRNTVHYMDCTLLLALINHTKQELVFQCWTLNDIFDCDMVDTGVRFMVFNATFNNISVISWQSVLLVKETEV